MADGIQDLANLFARVDALEVEAADNDQSITRIIKVYPTLGITVTITLRIHQYRWCGDENPPGIGGAICGAETYI